MHFGSLLAAVASFLESRTYQGRWLLRIEDIDPPRQQPDAIDLILTALECYGFEWDGPVIYQSGSHDDHDEALQRLFDEGHAYRCGCSRRDLAEAPQGPLGVIYPGYCRNGCDAEDFAVRVRTCNDPVSFADGLQGQQVQRLETESGDYVILRRDGLVAYHLAVAVDDHLQGISDIVRGIDLMDSTPRQIWLQHLLGYVTPRYLHIPVAADNRGQKLSKGSGAGGISLRRATATLHAALAVLGQQPPQTLIRTTTAEIWAWALENWDIEVLQGQTQTPVGHIALARA